MIGTSVKQETVTHRNLVFRLFLFGFSFGISLFGTTCVQTAGVWRVKADAVAGGNGLSWNRAFLTIQAAVDVAAASGGGEVWVAAGTYVGTGDQVVNIPAGVLVYGGFAGTESLRANRNSAENRTVIDGEAIRQGAKNAGLLNGFIVRNGKTSGFDSGGGIQNETGGTVTNCTVTGNTADLGGGISNNSGGMVMNCIVTRNKASIDGGGIYNSGGTVMNCTVVGNTATYGVGGIYNGGIVTNSIIWRNVESDISGNLTDVTYSCFVESTGSNGNLCANPRFVSASSDNPLEWDLRLQSDSSCIDSGTITAGSVTDFLCNPRPGGDGFMDMGAYESPDDYRPGKVRPPTTLCVSPLGDGSTGADWFHAFQKISVAIQAVQSSDDLYEIRVAAGVYREKTEIFVSGRVSLTGRWSGSQSNPAERDVTLYQTVVDGENEFRCITNYGLIEGLTVRNGKTDYGGGIYNGGVMKNCTVTDCMSNIGGGIYNKGSITDCTVKNCTVVSKTPSEGGGGVYNCEGTVTNSLVVGCAAKGDPSNSPKGGGILNHDGTVMNCTVATNMAAYGGGIFNFFDRGVVTNCVVTGNTGTSFAGGIYNDDGRVMNCTVAGNMGENLFGGGIYNSSHGTVKNSIVWHNNPCDIKGTLPGVTYSCFGEAVGQNGNLFVDPQFVFMAGSDPTVWNLRLRVNSLCIDAGITSEAPATDRVGLLRPQGKRIDMGAYECQGSS